MSSQLHSGFILVLAVVHVLLPWFRVISRAAERMGGAQGIDIRHGTGLETGLFPAICTDHPGLAGKSRIKVRGQVECALF